MDSSQYFLVIIDMQRQFSAANNRHTIAGCINEIELAIDRANPIIIITYRYYGPVVVDIKMALRGYPHIIKAVKGTDDGSEQITKLMSRRRFKWPGIETFRVCGVNAGACVRDTVAGLLRKLPASKIFIPRRAIGDCHYHDNQYITSLEKIGPAVVVV